MIFAKNTWNIRCLVDELFVPSAHRPSVLYCRLTDFCLLLTLCYPVRNTMHLLLGWSNLSNHSYFIEGQLCSNTQPQHIYKPHYDYQNFFSLANGVYLIAVTK